MKASTLRRLARLERIVVERANPPGVDLSKWTDAQLESAILMLTGKPPETRLTDEQLQAIMDGAT